MRELVVKQADGLIPLPKTVSWSQKQEYAETRRPILDNCDVERASDALKGTNSTDCKQQREDRANSTACTSTEENSDCWRDVVIVGVLFWIVGSEEKS